MVFPDSPQTARPKRKTKRPVQTTAKNKATKLHSELVRARGFCENCGTVENLQCAHIISRRYSHTRVRLDNAFCLCARCHMHFTEWPLEFHTFVVAKIGIDHYMELKAISQQSGKVDWVAELEQLRSESARMKNYAATEPYARASRGGMTNEPRH